MGEEAFIERQLNIAGSIQEKQLISNFFNFDKGWKYVKEDLSFV